MPKIFRIRYMPFEKVDLSGDTLLFRDDKYIVTEWVPIKKRDDISFGISCVFIDEGWKISGMMDEDKNIKYWYCDIIDIDYDIENDTYYLYDLLTDIRINKDSIEVLDLDELAEAFSQGMITEEQVLMSLKRTNNLLSFAYKNDLPSYTKSIIRKLTGKEC